MNFQSLFENAQEIKLKFQPLTKKLCVNCFKVVRSKFGESMICYNKKYNVVFFTNSQLKGYLKKTMCNLLSKDNIYYKDEQLSDIIKFSIDSINESGQINLTILKNKKINNNSDSFVIPLSDDDKIIEEEEVKPKLKAKARQTKINVTKSKIIDEICEEVNTDEIAMNKSLS